MVAALNGHTVAGGLMLALACDRSSWPLEGEGGAERNSPSVPRCSPGASEMLRFAVGNRNAEEILYTGAMVLPERRFV